MSSPRNSRDGPSRGPSSNGDRLPGKLDRLPPYDLDAEQRVLAGILRDPEILHEVSSKLEAGDFFRDEHQVIYRAMLAVQGRGATIDLLTVADELDRAGMCHVIDGREYLHDIQDSELTAVYTLDHVEIVREHALKRGLIDVGLHTLDDGYSQAGRAADLVTKAEQRIFAIAEREVRMDLASCHELMADAMARLEQRQRGELRGLALGFPDLDQTVQGLQPGQLILVAARPSMGKTAFLLNAAENIASHGNPVLFCSLEMGRQELSDRLICARAMVPGHEFRRPNLLTDAQSSAIFQAAGAISQLKIHWDDSPTRTVSQIAAMARRVKHRESLACIMVDYINLIQGSRQRGDSHEQERAEISHRLKAIARELGIPLVVACQLNRQTETRDDHRPRMSDLRETGALEQDADVVIMLFRPEYYKAGEKPGVCEVSVTKNRAGPIGKADLTFTRSCVRFDSMSHQQEPVF